jgi:hypothetical protein
MMGDNVDCRYYGTMRDIEPLNTPNPARRVSHSRNTRRQQTLRPRAREARESTAAADRRLRSLAFLLAEITSTPPAVIIDAVTDRGGGSQEATSAYLCPSYHLSL